MKNLIWNRRSFLKAAVVSTFLLLGRPAYPMELIEDIEQENLEDKSKFNVQEELGIKVPEARLLLFNSFTKEKLDVTFRKQDGEYDPQALIAINHLMRCHHTDEEIDIDIRVIEYLNTVDKKLGGDNFIHVVSGYRSPAYNKMLRKRNRRVARHSLHMEGKAIDIRIPEVKLKKIKRTALSMNFGGVGYYPRSGFIHLDSGRFRHW